MALSVLATAYISANGGGMWGKPDHAGCLPAAFLAILVVTPGATRLSIDSWISSWLNRSSHDGPSPTTGARPPRPVPIWPARLALVVLALLYFSAGLSKLRHGAVGWLNGTVIEYYLTTPYDQYFTVRPNTLPQEKWRDQVGLESFTFGAYPSKLGALIGSLPWLTRLLSIGTLMIEFGFIFALCSRRLMCCMLLLAGLMHIGIFVTVGPDFLNWIWCYGFFVNWSWVGGKVAQLARILPRQTTVDVTRTSSN
jgi:hypothetical protein